MTRRRIRPLPLLFLTIIWIMMMGGVTWANVVFGVIVASLVQWLFPLPSTISTIRARPVGLVVLYLTFLWDLVRASVYVAWLAVRPRPIGPGSLVDVTLRLEDDLRRTLVAELTSLVPGTVVIDLDQSSGVLTLHVLDVTDPDAVETECRRVRELEDRVEAALYVAQRPGAGAAPSTGEEQR